MMPSTHREWSAEDNQHDFPWVVNGLTTYKMTLESIPSVLKWNDPGDVFASLGVLDRSVCARRLDSAFDHIGRFEPGLSRKMRECFEALPPSGGYRFMTAPETVYQISRLRKKPADSTVRLCNFLNGESALHGRTEITDKQYWTALGDFYYAGPKGEQPSTGEDEAIWNRSRSYRAPYLSGTIPIDFFSPNIVSARETGPPSDYYEFSPEDIAPVCRHLEETLDRISAVSEVAARLVREFVKVIIPFKLPKGSGSTSQCDFPGRVLLRGIANADPARLAGMMVHESIHQLLYLLEYGGKFVVKQPDSKENIVIRSLWSGRDLDVYSFIHACFVWYGLANFWTRAQSSNAFGAAEVERELTTCLTGFRNQNPLELLGAHAGLIRYDVVRVASSLQDHLRDFVNYAAA